MSAIAFAIELLSSLPSLISAGVDVVEMIEKANEDLKRMKDENRDPLDSEWETLNATIGALRAQRPDLTE